MAESSNTQVTENQTVTISSSDGTEFTLPLELARQSGMIKSILAAECRGRLIPLPFVSSSIVQKLIEFWTNHVQITDEQWEDDFFKAMDKESLFDFLNAANYLDSKVALDSSSQFTADFIKDMTVEEVREYFGIENDFTPEEEEKIRNKNPWVFPQASTS